MENCWGYTLSGAGRQFGVRMLEVVTNDGFMWREQQSGATQGLP